MEPDAQAASRKEVGKAAAKGAFAMAIRQVATSAIGIGGAIVLARILSPADYGVFAIVTFCVGLFNLISDLGLGASLVRQSEKPDATDIKAIFTFQQILVGGFVVAIWLLAPLVGHIYSLQDGQEWLIRVLVVNLLLSTFQSFPNVLLERELRFATLARIEVSQVLAYNGAAIILAIQGWGPWAFVSATLLRSIVGASQSMIAARWVPGWHLDWSRVAHRMKFGMFYQGASTLSWIKDSIVPTLVGLLAGPAAVGFIGWAGGISVWAVLALQPLNRIYFPVFSRLQRDPAGLADAIERSIAWVNRIVAPVAIGVVALAPLMTEVVYTEKWLPALPLLYMLSVANAFAASSGPCMSALNALGKPSWNLWMTALWMGVTWIVGGIAIPLMGAAGFGVANIATATTSVILWVALKKLVAFRFVPMAVPPWLIAIVPGLVAGWLCRSGHLVGLPGLVAGALCVALPYLAITWAFNHKQIRRDIQMIRKPKAEHG